MGFSNENIPFNMPVQPANSGNGFGFGGEWSWFIVILFLFAFLGWGNGGLNNGGGNAGAQPGYVLTSDFSNIERKLDSVNSGICDGFYAMNTGMLNGFAGINQNISAEARAAETARCQAQISFMQQLNALQTQVANCCCENREAIQSVNYNLATQTCEVRNTIQNTTRDVMDVMNAGFRNIEQRLTAQELATKDAKIAEQNQQLFAAQLAASQAAQNETLKAYVTGQFAYYNPRPVPAFSVPTPYQYAGCCQ